LVQPREGKPVMARLFAESASVYAYELRPAGLR